MVTTDTQFDSDLARLRGDLEHARADFLAVLGRFSDDQLHLAKRGGWTVRRVLEHVISSEQAYARVIGHLRGQPIEGELPPSSPATLDDARAKLSAAREALLRALAGVDEDAFYALQQIGREEYSIISVLENARGHDHEHAEQLAETLQRS
ncbi:MAG: DinB family protein [Dehalococcoidia bacterium]